ncbi:tellurite resistance TerB family protein [Neisseria sp.]|uniref:tellurite resistance TerB family protein n=1 Tax=Neisseria sp. TaxID=192066 RepID=UPI00359FE3A7
MNFGNLLNQVLGAVQQKSGKGSGINSGMLSKIGGGAAAAGLAAALFKNKNTKKIATAGSMAALGALAYHAYQKYRENQNGQPLPDQSAFQPQGQLADNTGRVVLRTMIAAAASDGLIDEAERAVIQGESGEDAETARWIQAEMASPATPADIAREVGGNQALAAEAYLAARMVCADLGRKEIVFLSQLSQALQLDEKLVEALEQQAGF